MFYTENITQGLAIIADGIHANAITASTVTTSAVDLSKVRRVAFLVDAGTLGTSATLDFQVKGSSTSGGTYTAISGTAITQLTQAGSGSSKYAWVEVRVEQLVALGLGYNFLKGSLIVGTATSGAAVIVFADVDRYEPASNFNATSVAQTVVL